MSKYLHRLNEGIHMARDIRITPEVEAVLTHCTADGAVLKLPPTNLDRSLYTAVDKVLKALGGKWNRAKGGHVFSSGDPLALIADALGRGTATHLATAHGFYPTPSPLVDRLMDLADVQSDHTALEPSAGHGAIAERLRAVVGDDLTTVEMRSDNAQVLRERGFRPIEADFLEVDLPTFDRIVMNPPFEKKQDVAHVTRAFGLLAPGGRLVSVMSAGVLANQDRATQSFRDLVDEIGGFFEENPDGSFKPSGTNVWTVNVTLEKARSRTSGGGS